MSARDIFHEVVKQALASDGWANIAPITLRYGVTKLEIDLGADRFFAAKKGQLHIAVEVKSFATASVVYEFHQAIGQYIHYRMALKRLQPHRIPYLAIPLEVYDRFFRTTFFQDSLEESQVNLMLIDATRQEVEKWIPEPAT